MAASTIDERWTYYTLKWLTFTVNISTSNNTRYRCTGINRLWISDIEFKRLTDTYNTIRWTSNRLCRITNTFNITATTRTDRITTYRTIWMFLPLETAIGGTVDENSCDGPDVAQTNNLREKRRPSIRLQNITWLKKKHIRAYICIGNYINHTKNL